MTSRGGVVGSPADLGEGGQSPPPSRESRPQQAQRFGSGSDVEFSLGWLLDPLAVETFVDDIWGSTHYHVRRDCADYFDRLLSGPSAAEQLLKSFERGPSAVRFARGDDRHGADAYQRTDGSLDLDRVRNAFADGYTIVLDSVEQHVRTVASLSHAIEVELNFPVRINAYITPPGSQGFIAHYDEHDVLILQIHGTKLWHLYPGADLPPHQMSRGTAVDDTNLPSPTDVRLDVGDVLYLPRGRVHAAEATSGPSVHFTVGVHAPTLLALIIRSLYSLSLTDDRVHTQLPVRHLDDADARCRANALVRKIVSAVQEPSVIADGLGGLEDDLVKRGRCPPVPQAIQTAVRIDGSARVVKYQPLYSRVTETATGFALHFAQLAIQTAPSHKEALEFLSKSTESFRICDLPGLAAAEQIDLARTLLVAGFLVRLPDD